MLALGLATLSTACVQEEHVILLEVTSPEDLGVLTMTVIPLDGRGSPSRRPQTVDRDAASLRANPLRIAMRLTETREVMIILSAPRPTEEGNLVAQRCLVVSGPVHEQVWLVPIDRSEDADLDGFPSRPTITCARPNADASGGVPCAADDPVLCDGPGRVDCALDDPTRYPGAIEVCEDGLDQDCDGADARCQDDDHDGFSACRSGQDPLTDHCDCNDHDPLTYPNAPDSCTDPADTDCDGHNDLCDADGDGYPAASDGAPGAYTDCDDEDASVHPNVDLTPHYGLADGDRLARGFPAMPTTGIAVDRCTLVDGEPRGDDIDQDCNGFIDDGPGCTDTNDRDRDGWRACTATITTDCDPDDCDPGVNPGRRDICGNHIDEDGDGVDAPCPAGDLDHDGQAATTAGGRDCNDANPEIYDGAPENCLTTISESCRENLACDAYGARDADGDGFLAGLPAGVAGDCNDEPEFTLGTFPTCTPTDGTPPPCRAPATCIERADGTATCQYHGRDVRPFAPEDPCDGIDNNCNGIIDELPPLGEDGTRPWDGCVRIGSGATPVYYGRSDTYSEYCGGCGVVTAPNEDCCTGARVRVDQDSSCGSCGYVCGAHMHCERTHEDPDRRDDRFGCACDAPDASGRWTDCDHVPTNGCEIDLDRDRLNCGACGRACGNNQDCAGGDCACVAPFLDCDGSATNGCEANTANDTNHCGGCGIRCGEGETCNAGRCTCGGVSASGAEACPGAANVCCANTCIDTDTNPAHCGGCGVRCGASETCGGGRCRCGGTVGAARAEACPGAGNECCGSACVDTRSSTGNCASCGHDCAAGTPHASMMCAMSACTYSSCDPGWLDCTGGVANGCETPYNAIPNCGSCGNNCSSVQHATRTCSSSGTCDYSSCDAGWLDCTGGRTNGCETPYNAIPNCGSCGNNCSSVQHAARTCSSSGTCGYSSCDAGWLDCTGGIADGCETPNNALPNCGSCGNNCSSVQHAAPICATSGTCDYSSCDAGWLDCTGGRANGCETPYNAIPNCGSCGNNCSSVLHATRTCSSSGTCGYSSCDAGWLDCTGGIADGCETPNNALPNCGSCGNTCSSVLHATPACTMSGSCTFTTCETGYSDCDGDVTNGCEHTGASC